MNLTVVAVVLFIIAVLVIELLFHAWRMIRHSEEGMVRKRLKKIKPVVSYHGEIDILQKEVRSDIPWLNRVLLHMPGMASIQRLIRQANASYSPGFFILLSLTLLFFGWLGGVLILKNDGLALLLGITTGLMPLFYLQTRKKKRLEKFERQLPEALDLIARALRAGHAFTNGMKLAAEEFDDPLGTEFQSTLEEINFGSSVADALNHLATRIDCAELRFFIVSVILQRETGGNLSEIIENVSGLIRERFKLQGKIRVLSAEGKLSAIILVALPFILTFVIHILNPNYIHTLFVHPAGKMMIMLALILMILGIIVINRMIKIDI
jgi:tight adherence protein B